MTSEIELYEKKYPQRLVVMQNKILQAYHQMTLDEKRLIVLASPLARVIDATEKDAITISASDFATATGIKMQSSYKQLEQASKTLMQRNFSYKNKDGKRVRVQWVIRSIYDEGSISLCFTDEVLYMLKVFDKNNPFTKYEKIEVLKLKHDYSIDLYHIFKKYESMKEFVITLDELRQELGLSKAYDRISNLKSRVIKPALAEINKKTDIAVNYENVKKGRSVIAFKFTVKSKSTNKKSDTNSIDNLNSIEGLSDKQLLRITRHLDFIKAYTYLATGDNGKNWDKYSDFMINEIKKNPDKFNKKRPLREYLNGNENEYQY